MFMGLQQSAATGGAGGVPGADIPEQAGDPACLQEVQRAAAKGAEGERLLRARSQEPDPDAAGAAGKPLPAPDLPRVLHLRGWG